VQSSKRFHQKFPRQLRSKTYPVLLKPKLIIDYAVNFFAKAVALDLRSWRFDETPYQGIPVQCNSIHRLYLFSFFTSVVSHHKAGSLRL
jgi:hypothetical protein